MHQPMAPRAFVRRFAACALLLWLALLLPQLAVAAPSTFCPTLGATVANGGSVQIDVSTCDGPFDAGMSEPITGFGAAHGTVTIGPNSAGTQYVTYAHDGGAATSDSFALEDENGDILTVNVTIGVATSPIDIAPPVLPTITAGAAFNQALLASGGTAPYTYAVVAGTLPTGLTLSGGGVLSGTPTRRGGYSFTVRAQDATSTTGEQAYTGTVANPSISTTPTAGTAYQGVPFSQTVVASGGVAPYVFSLDSGTLPAGIAVSAGGTVSGTTSAPTGTYAVSLRVTDSSTGPGVYFELEPYTLTLLPPPSVTVSVSPAAVDEDGATPLVYTFTRSVALDSATVVNLGFAGTATSNTDYTGAVSTVSIPAGATSATLVITPVADPGIEADETVIVTVAAGAGYVPGTPAAATGTIRNDDVPTATIAVSPAAVQEDGAPNLVYTVTFDQAALSPVSVAYSVGGTASAGSDFTVAASPLVIPAGTTSATLVVNPTADGTVEADETVVIGLQPGTGYTVGSPSTATGTILNDDLPVLSIADVSIVEGDAGTSTATFTVSLTQPAGPSGVAFDIATADGTATAGSDYVARSLAGQTIGAGASSYVFAVTVNGDTLNEADETFFVNVTNVTGAVVADGQAQGTITNDDPLPALSIGDANVVEGASGTSTAVFTVSLNAASGRAVSVNYATADGTATAPGDYTATSGSLSFSAGQTSTTISVAVVGDIVPEADETFFVNLSGAVNAVLADAQGTGTILNDDVPVTVAPATLPDGTAGVAYSATVSASGGAAPYTFAVTAGALPAGLTLAPSGALTGTPTAVGSFAFTITATDSSGFPGPFTGSRAYTLTIAAPVIAVDPATVPQATRGVAYTQTITASGGTAPHTFTVTAGALPAGLTLSASGTLSGTPTVIGTFDFTITATDSSTGTGAPFSGSRAYSLVVVDQAPVAGPSTQTVGYGAGATPLTLALSGGAATSLTLVTPPSHGSAQVVGTTINYTPQAGYAGPDSLVYTASNSGGTSAPATVSITVSAPVITVTPSAPLSTTVGASYTQTFTWSGGASPYGSYQASGLPAGLSVTGSTSTTLTIAGTPTQAGTFNVEVGATDSSTGTGPFTTTQTFVLTVSAPSLSLSPASGTFNATYGAAYAQAFAASGGIGPYTYAVTGSLPPGVSLSGDTLSGTPTAPGSYAFTITATDTGSTGAGAPFTVSQSYTLQVSAPTIVLDPATLPGGTAAQAYSQSVSATGGVGPYTYAVTAGTLPAGLSLSASGLLAGTPTQAGTFAITITATDANGQSGSRAYTLTIGAPALVITPATLPAGTAGVAYSQTFATSGGIAPYTYALASGALPSGLTLGSAGTLSGTPTQAGTFAFEVRATDSTAGAAGSTTVAYTLTIASPTIAIGPAALPQATSNVAYTQAISATGGTAPYTFAVTAGALPAGLALSTSGTLSGTPTAAGSHAFTVTATDALGFSASRAYTLVVIARPDPSRDPDVRGLIDAQAQASRRFAGAQIDNFQQRMESLHGVDRRGFSNGVSLLPSSRCRSDARPDADDACHGPMSHAAAGDDAGAPDGSGSRASGPDAAFGLWAGGAIRSGRFDGGAGGGGGLDFETDGVSLGADMRLAPGFAVGAGIGFGRDRSDVGRSGSRIRGESRAIVGYASLQPGGTFFVDTLVGYQRLDFDLRRHLGATGGSVVGERDGRQWFGSVSAGADLGGETWQLTPYVRVDLSRTRLEAFQERGDPVLALAYGAQDVDATTGVLGLRGELDGARAWGRFSPMFRLEVQHDFQADGTATMRYADLPGGTLYTADVLGFDRTRYLLGLGGRVVFANGVAIRIEYRGLFGSDERDNGLMFNLQKTY